MTDTQDVERIQFKMQRIRRHMDEDVNRLQADAEQLLNWRYYILRHPIASLFAVAAVGYALVPKSHSQTEEKKIYLDPEASRVALQGAEKLQIDQGEQVAQQSVLMTLGTLALSTLVKAGVAYAGQQLRETFLQDFKPHGESSPRNVS